MKRIDIMEPMIWHTPEADDMIINLMSQFVERDPSRAPCQANSESRQVRRASERNARKITA